MDMDMDMSGMDHSSSSSSSSMMAMVFVKATNTPLYSMNWQPSTPGQYAGTCIFLIILAILLRVLFAGKSLLEQRWVADARARQYVMIKGRSNEAARIDSNPDAKSGTLITAQGVEENVKVVRAATGPVLPFRLSVDIPRALLMTAITAVAYLLMLAVMTMNVGYFCAVLGGTFAGELLVGRYAAMEEH